MTKYLSSRTMTMIAERRRAGDSLSLLARDYGISSARARRIAECPVRVWTERCMEIGGLMANLCFNLGQHTGRVLNDAETAGMRDLQTKWDYASRKLREVIQKRAKE